MHWMLLPYRRYFDFRGRSRPKEYWLFALFLFLALAVLGYVDAARGLGGFRETVVTDGPFGASYLYRQTGGTLTHLFALFSVVPSLAVAVRRLHDTTKRGWWLLLGLFPVIGTIVLLIFLVTPGTRGGNRYGADPLGGFVS